VLIQRRGAAAVRREIIGCECARATVWLVAVIAVKTHELGWKRRVHGVVFARLIRGEGVPPLEFLGWRAGDSNV
jgi:hypothetical protein